MRIKILTVILTVLIVSGQTVSLNSFLPLSMSLNRYKDPQKMRNLTEVDISFYERHLRSIAGNSKDSLDMIVNIYKDGKLISRGWHQFALKPFFEDSVDEMFLDQFVFALDPGKYNVFVSVNNRSDNKKIKGEINGDIVVDSFDMNAVQASDPLISNLISRPEPGESRFIRNGIYIQPYPQKTFFPKMPLLYYYWEIYNLNEGQINSYSVKIEIKDENGEKVKSMPPGKLIKMTDDYICMGGQNIMALKNGDYKFVISLEKDGKEVLSRESGFSVYKRKKKKEITQYKIMPELANLSGYEIDDEIHFLKYILKDQIKNRLKNAKLKEKKIILTKFWEKNDYDKKTAVNEFRRDYLKLVKYVRENFSDSRNDGVDTDMGRVVLLYGIPDQRQKIVDDEIIGQNVEVWTYNKNSRYDFVFAQENYIGPYILVHSNMPGETRDRKWENYLKNNRDRIR